MLSNCHPPTYFQTSVSTLVSNKEVNMGPMSSFCAALPVHRIPGLTNSNLTKFVKHVVQTFPKKLMNNPSGKSLPDP